MNTGSTCKLDDDVTVYVTDDDTLVPIVDGVYRI
jgi:hypothetical protein